MLALLQKNGGKRCLPSYKRTGASDACPPTIETGRAMLALLQGSGAKELGDFLLERRAVFADDGVSVPDGYEVARRADSELRRSLRHEVQEQVRVGRIGVAERAGVHRG